VTPIEACLRRLKRDLDASKVPWAIVGGFAVQARAYPRTTLDIDAAVVAADDDAASDLARRLLERDYRVLARLEQTEVSRLGTLRLISPVHSDLQIVVDLLFASSGIEAEVVKGAGAIQLFRGLTLPVATPEGRTSTPPSTASSRSPRRRPIGSPVARLALAPVASAHHPAAHGGFMLYPAVLPSADGRGKPGK
jgi:hypothetical protein